MADPILVESLVAEVVGSNFKNKQLNDRLGALVMGLARDPALSLPRAFDAGDLEGAYRFFSNVAVTPAAILEGHYEAARRRCEEVGQDFLVAHDSTSFSYRHDGERRGLGRAQNSNKKSKQTFHAHVSLAICADATRRPLGVAGLKTWVRGTERSRTEQARWLEQIRASSRQLNGLKHALHLADREADDYELFAALQQEKHRFVIRCMYDRRVAGPIKAKLRETVTKVTSSVEREVSLSRRTERRTEILRKIHPTRSARIARLSIAGTTVVLQKPHSSPGSDPSNSLPINLVRVWEPEPPVGEEPVEWYLYTTDPIDTPEQQLKIVDHYRARWTIEEYFKAIKTGCDFERRQLKDYESLVNLLATFAPIAYRMLLIRSEAARAPEQPASAVVSPVELEVLQTCGRRKLSCCPTASEVYLAIAALGGYIKRAENPGWRTLARGFEKLQTLTEGWVAAKVTATQ